MVEKSGKVHEGHVTAGGRIIRHFRSSSVPIPLALDNMVHFSASPPVKQSLQQNIEDGAGSGSLSSPRKQPPPKPKRDPNTRLSASYEAVSAGLTMAAKESYTPEGSSSPAGSPPKSQLSPSDPAGTDIYFKTNYFLCKFFVRDQLVFKFLFLNLLTPLVVNCY